MTDETFHDFWDGSGSEESGSGRPDLKSPPNTRSFFERRSAASAYSPHEKEK